MRINAKLAGEGNTHLRGNPEKVALLTISHILFSGLAMDKNNYRFTQLKFLNHCNQWFSSIEQSDY